jgi:phosphoglucosamine mutase
MTLGALEGSDLAQATPMRRLPQVLANVEVATREAIADAAAVWEAAEREGDALEGRGRVLIRPSGTEPLVRVMVEAPEQAEAEAVCARLVDVVRAELA